MDFLPLADEAATQSDKSDQSDSEMEEEEEVLSDRLTDGGMNSNCERKSARFTEYSLSSSVVPRNDGTYVHVGEVVAKLQISYSVDAIIGSICSLFTQS